MVMTVFLSLVLYLVFGSHMPHAGNYIGHEVVLFAAGHFAQVVQSDFRRLRGCEYAWDRRDKCVYSFNVLLHASWLLLCIP